MSPYTRRDALRVGLGAVSCSLAGCVAAPGRDSDGEGSGRPSTTDRAATPDPRPILRMERVPPAEVGGAASVAIFSQTLRSWLDRAIEAGAIELPDGTGRGLALRRADFVRYDGGHYDLSIAQVRRESSYELTIDRATGTVRADAAIVRFEELSADEQAAVRNARRGEATVGFHEAYDGRYEFARGIDYVEHEGRFHSLSVTRTRRFDEHTDLRIEPVERSAIGADATVFDLAYVALPDGDRSAVAEAMRTGSASAREFSTPLETAVESMDYVAGTGAIYAARIENPE